MLELPIRKFSELQQLIPHREPMVMVDALLSVNDKESKTEFTILQQNIFVGQGVLQEAGLIEHMAQSAALREGFNSHSKIENPKIGYIASINKVEISMLPNVGDTIETTVKIEFQSIVLQKASVVSKLKNKIIATAVMTNVISEN